MSGFASTAMSIAMIAAFVLIAGGIKLMVAKKDRRRGALMVVAAMVLIGNVLIWTL